MLSSFYTSKDWVSLMRIIRMQRVNSQGELMCEHCGKPIVHKYDCRGHHVIELTENNYQDANISLNPDNIILVHHKCHNEIHKRFGFSGTRKPQEVYIVWGSPCSGKTTWVNSVAEKNDIILDIDKLWNAVKSESCGEFYKPNALKDNVFALRDLMLDMIRVRRGRWQNAYVIGGYPFQADRERTAALLGARLIFIDTPKEVCLQRAAEKGGDLKKFVEIWWERAAPGSDPSQLRGGLGEGLGLSQRANF